MLDIWGKNIREEQLLVRGKIRSLSELSSELSQLKHSAKVPKPSP